jgi:dipeptidase E
MEVTETEPNILLIDSSIHQGSMFLEYALENIQKFVANSGLKVCIVPFATSNQTENSSYSKYCDVIKKSLIRVNKSFIFTSLHESNIKEDLDSILRESDIIFIGGGNTHRLIYTLHSKGIFNTLKEVCLTKKVIGVSAGSVLFSKTLNHADEMIPIAPPDNNGFNLLNDKYIYPHSDELFESSDSRKERLVQEFVTDNHTIFFTKRGSILKLRPSVSIESTTKDTVGCVSRHGKFFRKKWFLDKKYVSYSSHSEAYKFVLPQLGYAEDIMSYTNSEHAYKYTSIPIGRSLKDIQNMIRKYIAFNNNRKGLKLFIKDIKKGVIVGGVNLNILKNRYDKSIWGEISIVLSEELSGKGLGSKFIGDIIKLGEQEFDLNKFVAKIVKDNTPSLKAFQKHGFSIQEKIEGLYKLKGEVHDAYVLTNSDNHHFLTKNKLS